MADLLPPLEIEFRIALLPPISRGAHLDGPLLHARRLVDLWKIDDGDHVLLAQGFRLLDVETVAGAIFRRCGIMDCPGDARYWTFPTLEDLLPELRETAWRAMQGGGLSVEAIKGVRGNRYRTVLPAELPRLTPDWELSRLMLDGRDEFINVRVRRTPAEPVKKAWRAKPSLAELKLVIVDIALGYPQAQERPETRPSFEEVWIKLRAHFETEIPRDDVRKALDVAPHLKRGRGQHGKSQS